MTNTNKQGFKYKLYVSPLAELREINRHVLITIPRDYAWQGYFNVKCYDPFDKEVKYKHPEMAITAYYEMIGEFDTYEQAFYYYMNNLHTETQKVVHE